MSMTLDRRLQLLIDEDCWSMLETEAKRESMTVAAVVRQAIDDHFAGNMRRRAEAGRRLLAMSENPTPGETEPSWAEIKRAMEEDLERRYPL
jgi:chromosomal replication initiation ATPase DnaA